MKLLRWIREIIRPTGWCWHCELPWLGKVCPVHKVRMQPMKNGHEFR